MRNRNAKEKRQTPPPSLYQLQCIQANDKGKHERSTKASRIAGAARRRILEAMERSSIRDGTTELVKAMHSPLGRTTRADPSRKAEEVRIGLADQDQASQTQSIETDKRGNDSHPL